MNDWKITQGELRIRKNGLNIIKILGFKTKKVCEINCNLNNKIDSVNEANATLIAAAPEMLEALEFVVRVIGKPDFFEVDMLAKAKAAIAKAKLKTI